MKSDTNTILVVDDNSNNLHLLTTLLSDSGHKVSTALDGQSAILLSESFYPDLILLDVMMSGLNGFETCKRLKSSPKTKNIPIIFITARTDTDSIVKGFEVGAIDYIFKPINAATLLARVKTHLELKKSRDNQEKLIAELQEALSQIKKLSGLLPICAKCKKIRDDKGYWNQIETYIANHSEALFTHGLCPHCAEKLYGYNEAQQDIKMEKTE